LCKKIKNKVASIYCYFKNCNKVLFIFLMFVLSILLTIVLSPLFDLFDITILPSSGVEEHTDNKMHEFTTAVIIAPLVETLIFQILLIEFLYLTKIGKRKIVILSAIIFSITHYYSIGYIFYAFSMGVIFSYSYIIRENTVNAFLTVYAIHVLRNTVAFIV